MGDITVIVPCYNGAELLPRCVDSLLGQTVKDLSIIIVNDGSTDQTGAVAEAYAKRCPRVRVMTKSNEGLPQARKSGLAWVDTPYVGFVDSDDWVEPELYEKLLAALKAGRADIACAGLFMDWGDHLRPVRQVHPTGSVLSGREAMCSMNRREDVYPYMWNKLYRSELFRGVNFPHGNFTGEDYVTTVQLLSRAERVAIVNEPLCHYMQTASSMSRGGFRPAHKQSYQSYQQAEKVLIQRYPEFQTEIRSYLCTEYLSFLVAMSRNKVYDRVIAQEVMVYVRRHLRDYLKASYVEKRYKVSALAAAVNYRVLAGLYRLQARLYTNKGQ